MCEIQTDKIDSTEDNDDKTKNGCIHDKNILARIAQDPRIIYCDKQISYYEGRISKFPPPKMPNFYYKLNQESKVPKNH